MIAENQMKKARKRTPSQLLNSRPRDMAYQNKDLEDPNEPFNEMHNESFGDPG